jgi:hypothetical protein
MADMKLDRLQAAHDAMRRASMELTNEHVDRFTDSFTGRCTNEHGCLQGSRRDLVPVVSHQIAS